VLLPDEREREKDCTRYVERRDLKNRGGQRERDGNRGRPKRDQRRSKERSSGFGGNPRKKERERERRREIDRDQSCITSETGKDTAGVFRTIVIVDGGDGPR